MVGLEISTLLGALRATSASSRSNCCMAASGGQEISDVEKPLTAEDRMTGVSGEYEACRSR
jgi:hypothetical protein